MGQLDFTVEGSGLFLGEGWDSLPSRLPIGGWMVKYHVLPSSSETALIDVLSRYKIETPISVSLQLRGPNSDPNQFGWLSLDGIKLSFGLYITEYTRDRLISLIQFNVKPNFLTIRSKDIDCSLTAEKLIDTIGQRTAIIQSYNLIFE